MSNKPDREPSPLNLAFEARVFLEYMKELGLNDLGVDLPKHVPPPRLLGAENPSTKPNQVADSWRPPKLDQSGLDPPDLAPPRLNQLAPPQYQYAPPPRVPGAARNLSAKPNQLPEFWLAPGLEPLVDPSLIPNHGSNHMSPPPTPRSTARPAAANAAGAPPLDSRATPIFEAIFDSDYIPPPASVDSRQPSLPARQANFPEPSQANTLEELAAFTLNCQRCHLAQPSKTLGQGPLNPPITLVLNSTEGDHLWPTGAAGKLLTEIITDGLNLAVEEVYVTRILKCRVKNLANLKPLEQKKCFELITREIILVNPQIVIALGEFPGQVLTQSNKSMFFLRIKPFFVLNSPQRIPLQIIYDLGPTLESLEVKKDMWRDLEKAKRLANLI